METMKNGMLKFKREEVNGEDVDLEEFLFDESNEKPLMLYGEEGDLVLFEHGATIPFNEKIYAVLGPIGEFKLSVDEKELEQISKVEGVEDGEAVIMFLDADEEGNTVLVPEEDDDACGKVFEQYLAMKKEDKK